MILKFLTVLLMIVSVRAHSTTIVKELTVDDLLSSDRTQAVAAVRVLSKKEGIRRNNRIQTCYQLMILDLLAGDISTKEDGSFDICLPVGRWRDRSITIAGLSDLPPKDLLIFLGPHNDFPILGQFHNLIFDLSDPHRVTRVQSGPQRRSSPSESKQAFLGRLKERLQGIDTTHWRFSKRETDWKSQSSFKQSWKRSENEEGSL